MNKNNLEDRLHKLNTYKTIQLTEEEKNTLRSHAAYVVSHVVPKQKVESLFYRGVQHTIQIALSTFLFIVFIGSSVSVVANSALPGDPLYSVKLNINEKAQGLFLHNPEDKVAWQKSRIENRVNEIKTLAETKTLTKAKQATVNKALDSHVKALSKELTTLSNEEPSAALTVTASLEDSLLAGKEELKVNDGDENLAGALQAIDDTLKVVSNEEVKIISKEIDNITTAAQTAPTSVEQNSNIEGSAKTETTVTPPPAVTPSKP